MITHAKEVVLLLETEMAVDGIPEETSLLPSYRRELREYSEKQAGKYIKMNTVSDWSMLSWKDIGKPYEVSSFAKGTAGPYIVGNVQPFLPSVVC
jgi:hypothetical protein